MPPAPAPEADELLHAAPVALLHVGADGVLLRCNAAAQALCGPAATPGQAWAGVFAVGSVAALPGTAPAPPQRLSLRDDPGREVTVSSQALAAGGWMLALHPLRDTPGGAPGEAESALALAVELGHIAVWRHDLATDRVHFNARAFDVLDMPSRPDGMTVAEARALVHPDDLPRVVASAQRALDHDGPSDMQARYRRADGSWRQVMTRRMLQRDAEGRPKAFIGVALDVSDHSELQRHAEDMARRFERATGAAGIGYWVLGRADTHATWSPALRELFDLPPQAPVPAMADWLAAHLHPDDREHVRRQFADWARSRRESLALPMRILRPDGSLRYLSTHSLIERSGPRPLMFGVVIDLTERRSAELALRNAQERVALAARGAGLGTWELDLRSGVAFWDEQMWLLRGHAPQPRAMSEAERLACVHPDDRSLVHEQLGQALDHGVPFENEFRVVWPDGQLRWLASRSAEIRDEQSGARRRIGVNWDVTDKRTAEAARREREMAQRESLAKSRFLARMSHELRTPLNAVLGFSQLLLAEAEAGAGGPRALTRRRQLEHIHTAGEHLLVLINDVLDLSSLESGELRIQLQPVPLAPLLAQTVPMLDALRSRHGVELQLGALPGVVMADATRLRQVLLNLMSNAVKYNLPGGQVRVDALAQGTEVLIRVADTGRGMSPEQLRHLYEPFNRLGRQSEGADGVEGSGIGLAIVKALMERMGGSVQVHSTPGVGSVFELRLADAAPAAQPGGPPAAAPAPAAAGGGATAPRGTLLYVEDNAVNALIVSELIARRKDLRLHIAPDGSSGVRRAMELQPDLVLLDMQLPDFDGHEVLRRLRAHPALAQVPVIALSANAMPEDIERALRAGIAEYWTKPLDFVAFMSAMDRMFGPA